MQLEFPCNYTKFQSSRGGLYNPVVIKLQECYPHFPPGPLLMLFLTRLEYEVIGPRNLLLCLGLFQSPADFTVPQWDPTPAWSPSFLHSLLTAWSHRPAWIHRLPGSADLLWILHSFYLDITLSRLLALAFHFLC